MARAFWKAIALAVGLSGTAHSHEFVAKPADGRVRDGCLPQHGDDRRRCGPSITWRALAVLGWVYA
jgi:hypothetical protein